MRETILCLQLLPNKMSSTEQKEILNLLCKVHELEIENMQMQSSCLLRNFELRKKDMQVAKMEQHRLLCDEIIQQQRVLIEAGKVWTVYHILLDGIVMSNQR